MEYAEKCSESGYANCELANNRKIEQAKKDKLTIEQCRELVAKKYDTETFCDLFWDYSDAEGNDGYESITQLYDQASEMYANQFITAATAEKWISVNDRLPEIQVPVLVYLPKYGEPNILPMWIEELSGQWFNTAWQFKQIDEVTHWMPLPDSPGESNTNT